MWGHSRGAAVIQTSHQVLDLQLLALASRRSLPRPIVETLRFVVETAWRVALKNSNENPDHPAFQNPSVSIWQKEFENELDCHRSTIYRRGKLACDKGLLTITPARVVMKSADECRRESGNLYSLTGELRKIWRAMVAAYRACRDPDVRAAARRSAIEIARQNEIENPRQFNWPNQVFTAIAAGVESVWTRRPAAGSPPPPAAEISRTSDAAAAPAPAAPEKNPLIAVLERAAAAGDTFAAGLLAALTGRKKDDPPDKI